MKIHDGPARFAPRDLGVEHDLPVGRLAAWGRRVLSAGGLGWRAFMDATRLTDYLGEVRAS